MGPDGAGGEGSDLARKLKESGTDRQYLEMMRSILKNDVVGFAILDTDGRYQVFNPGATKLTGYGRDDIITKRPPDGMFNEETLNLINEAIEKNAPVKNVEITITRNDGSAKDLILSMSPEPGRSGNDAHFLQIFLDNSEKNHLRRLLLHSQKMETIGEMAGGIAHDFNNLLEGVLGYTTFMMDLIEKDHELLSYLEIIERSARKAADLTDRLLTLSRTRDHEKKLINCNKLLKEVSKLLERTIDKKIVLELNLFKNLKATLGASGQLDSAFLNICMNARDAMPDGGKLIIKSENIVIDETYPKMSLKMERGEYIRISISDTGIGMDDETARKIFEPFFTTKKRGEGTGLGLNMVYGIIDSHGGFINVYSEVGKGTIFNIYLPAEEGEVPEYEEEKEKPPLERGNGELVLVIDDEQMILDIGFEMLEKLGYKVITAGEADKGLEYFMANSGKIDIVLLDVIMPGVDGREVLRQIRAVDADVPVVLSSGYDRSVVDEDISTDDPNIAFIQKPYSLDDLGRCIQKNLRK